MNETAGMSSQVEPQVYGRSSIKKKKHRCECNRAESKECELGESYRAQNVPQRYRHNPNMIFSMNPTTMPICMRRLIRKIQYQLNHSKTTRARGGVGNAYVNTVLSGVSRACPLSQNAAGLGARKKKKGRSGKKKPTMVPLSTARARESPSADPPLAPPPLPRESIHCSSSARACSSSVRE
jgi:hypothetical protein